MKLRTRLYLMLLTLSLIPLLIFSAVSVTSFVLKSKKDTYQLCHDKLEVAKAEIEGMLDKHFTTLQTLAKQPAIRNYDLAEVKSILVDAAKVNPDLVLTLDNARGDQLVRSNDEDLINVSQREFFQQAMSGKEACVSDIIVSLTTNDLILVIATPVRDVNNNIIGVLQAHIFLNQISEFVTEISKGDSNVYILSRQGTVLAHPNNEYVQNQEDFSALEFVQAGLAGENATLETKNIQGENVIVSHYLDELSGWLIVVETPVSVAMASVYNLLSVSILAFIAVTIVVGLIGLYFSRWFTKPLVELSSIIKTIAMGDLKDFDVNIKSKDEIGELYHSLKAMTKNLRELIGNIQTVASTLASHSMQLSSITDESTQSLTQVVTTISEIAQGNSDQALMVQQSTDAITRVNNIVSEATTETETAADKANESLELAKEGQKALETQSQKIEENIKYTNAVGESIHQLATMTDEIRNIIGAINSIAEQTNLLALNASIEAARAGEAGRGFAVVAEEIRKLAEQSRSSTKRIEDIVNGINGRVDETVNNMNQVRESVLAMESSAENTRESFAKIFDSVTELAKITQDVSTALDEINNQINEITNQATNISSVVEQTSAGMQEISAASEEQLASFETIDKSSGQLENIAQDLLTQVTKFKVQ
mgnify:CR=1 FL=1